MLRITRCKLIAAFFIQSSRLAIIRNGDGVICGSALYNLYFPLPALVLLISLAPPITVEIRHIPGQKAPGACRIPAVKLHLLRRGGNRHRLQRRRIGIRLFQWNGKDGILRVLLDGIPFGIRHFPALNIDFLFITKVQGQFGVDGEYQDRGRFNICFFAVIFALHVAVFRIEPEVHCGLVRLRKALQRLIEPEIGNISPGNWVLIGRRPVVLQP